MGQTETAEVTRDSGLVPAATRRQSLLEVGIATIGALISTTLVGFVWPVSVKTGQIDIASLGATTDPIAVILPVFLLGFFVPFSITLVLAVVLVEGRRPWPFGRRSQRPAETNWELFPAMAAGFVAQEAVRQQSDAATRLFVEGDGYLWIGIPASVASGLVVWLAVFSTTYLVGHAVHTAYLARTRAAVSTRDRRERAA